MFRIDKSFVERMNRNKEVVVITNKNVFFEERSAPETPVEGVPEPEKVSYAEDAARARELVEKAKEQAAAMMEAARQNAEQLQESARQQGFQKGYREGYRQGKEKGEQEMAGLIQAQKADAAGVFQKLEAYKQQIHNDLSESVLGLSLAIAEKIINLNLEKDDSIYKEIAKKAVFALESTENFTLHVSRTEYDRFFADGGQWLQREVGRPFEVVCDPSMEPGSCIAESEDGVVNSGVQEQLTRLARDMKMGKAR